MFEFLSKLFRPKQKQELLPTLTDPLFGPLIYFPAARLWSGKIHFAPASGEIEILIEADGAGPTESHREFFHATVARWPEIQASVGDILFPPIKKWAKRDYDESNPWGYFDLRGIRLPSLTAEPAEWSVSYWCPSVTHHFDVHMSDWKADGLEISRK